MIGLFGLGLLPKGTLIGAGLVVVALLTLLGQRQCTVMQLEGEVEKAQVAADNALAAKVQCELREQALGSANERLADSLTRQTAAFDEWAAAEAAAQAQTQAALAAATNAGRAQQRAAEEDRARAAWLADLAGRQRTAADTCEAALGKVREGLR